LAVFKKSHALSIYQRELNLKQKGNRWVASCPFHYEKTPSFFVFSDGGFKCFGCGKSGDIFTFIQDRHGFTFPETLNYLGLIQDRSFRTPTVPLPALTIEQEVVEDYKLWIKYSSLEAATLMRVCWKIKSSIKTLEDFEKSAVALQEYELWKHRFDMLLMGDNDMRLELYGHDESR
jgi:hypothetical protein